MLNCKIHEKLCSIDNKYIYNRIIPLVYILIFMIFLGFVLLIVYIKNYCCYFNNNNNNNCISYLNVGILLDFSLQNLK